MNTVNKCISLKVHCFFLPARTVTLYMYFFVNTGSYPYLCDKEMVLNKCNNFYQVNYFSEDLPDGILVQRQDEVTVYLGHGAAKYRVCTRLPRMILIIINDIIYQNAGMLFSGYPLPLVQFS